MGVGNKPFLDIKPSDAAINDRAIDYIMKGRGEPVYHDKQQLILWVNFTSITLSLLLQGPGREHPLPSRCLTTPTHSNELQ